MEKFRAIAGYRVEIKNVEVEKETASSIWINGRRNAKRSDYHNYFDTFQEAKDFCIAESQKRVDGARHQLNSANDVLGNAKGLKP